MATEHGLWVKDVINIGSDEGMDPEPIWVITVTCWCGVKYGPVPEAEAATVEAELAEHVANPPTEPD